VVFNPLSLFAPARWAVDLYRKYRQARRQVTVLVHGPAAFLYGGASPLTPTEDVSVAGAPVTGTGGRPGTGDWVAGAGHSLCWFMKVNNKSQARDIELTYAYFTGAQDDQLLTSAALKARLKPDETWEG
jgi:hypothetical protein